MGANRSGRRQGSALVYFVMILFALMGLAALVIDLGFARLTQRQMQTAADTAALEGLRGRDDTTKTDQQRRQDASDLVSFVFDDDFNPQNGDPYHFGAGPVLNMTGGTGVANAGQTLSLPDPPVYDPVLQLNLDNAMYGDLVSGTFDGTATTHQELADYQRSDFMPDTANKTPPGNSFLVRLRRTNDLQGLDKQPGISSSERALPYLFGRGTVLPGGDPSKGYSPRFHGITVRATAIADARRVLSVGPAYPASLYSATTPDFQGIPGAAPFALTASFWQNPSAGPYTVDNAGVITDAQKNPVGQLIRTTALAADLSSGSSTLTVSSAQGFPTTTPFRIRIESELLQVTAGAGTTTWTVQRGVEGTTSAGHPKNRPVLWQAVLSLTRPLTDVASGPPPDLSKFAPAETQMHTYAPVYDQVNSVQQIIGFGLVTWAPDPSAPNRFQTIAPQAAKIAPQNASGVLAEPVASFPGTPPLPQSLLAPVLAR